MENLTIVFSNTIMVVISVVALGTYTLLVELCFLNQKNEEWLSQAQYWHHSIKILITALPLLGLLGTITGLMETFFALSLNNSMELQELMASGISDAMFSTQYGLALAIPGLVLNSFLHRKIVHFQLELERP